MEGTALAATCVAGALASRRFPEWHADDSMLVQEELATEVLPCVEYP